MTQLSSPLIFDGLNPQQLEAVRAVRGPVCIQAGAGSGKTTTITRRIANQVYSDAFRSHEILAVTFTDKAAKEMAARLESLGVPGVRAKTFHGEAKAQYHRLTDASGEVLASKVSILKSLVAALPPPHKFISPRDIATEIEWAKNQRIGPQGYLEKVGDHEPPVPREMMARIYAGYEQRKQRAGMLDFEDLLERTIEMLESNHAALCEIQNRYRAFTVDEYQDANLLQQTLLELWLGERRDICVVGDDYQSIYGFTGATARYLLEFPARHPGCEVIDLTLNYRSTPQVLETANRLVPRMQGSSKALSAAGAAGEAALIRCFDTGAEETAWIAGRAKQLNAAGVAWEEMAVLYRINARSEVFEEAFSTAGIAYQVADSPFLRRAGARAALSRLRKRGDAEVASVVAEIAASLGYSPEAQNQAQGEEATRLADLGRLVLLASQYEGGGGVFGFLADLTSRFSEDNIGRGINLLTFHKAKGKEYAAVFLPRLEEKELPFALASSPQRLAEERRLFYVGITRAKRHLFLTAALRRDGERPARREPSRFLREIDPRISVRAAPADGQTNSRRAAAALSGAQSELLGALKAWRKRVVEERNVPAYVVFWDSTLTEIAQRRPSSPGELLKVKGVGQSKVNSFGKDVLELVRSFAS